MKREQESISTSEDTTLAHSRLEKRVRIYKPPRGSEITPANRKEWFTISMIVKQKLSDTTSNIDDGKIYRRARTNICRSSTISDDVTHDHQIHLPGYPSTTPPHQRETERELPPWQIKQDEEDMIFQIIGTFKNSIDATLYKIFTRTKDGKRRISEKAVQCDIHSESPRNRKKN